MILCLTEDEKFNINVVIHRKTDRKMTFLYFLTSSVST